MPGGAEEAWSSIEPIFSRIAAKAEDGTPCCAWVGKGGAGHFVKMVHNGIEYGDMQLIADAYAYLRHIGGKTNEEMSQNLRSMERRGSSRSYLVEITAEILVIVMPRANTLSTRSSMLQGRRGLASGRSSTPSSTASLWGLSRRQSMREASPPQ